MDNDFASCKQFLAHGKRARRQAWRDSGQYIISPYRGKHWEGMPAADCDAYLIGDSENIIAWPDMNAELLERDWEIMPEPDYEAFGKAVFEMIPKKHPYLRVCQRDLYELLSDHGLAYYVSYNPKLHGAIDADVGEMVWYLGG